MKRTIKVECQGPEWLYVSDVVYGKYGDIERKLQLLVPYRQEWKEDERYPLVMFIPGSAWYRQEMYNSIPALSGLAERGIIIAAVQYRESTIARYPAQVEDAERAAMFLMSKAEAFHIDTDRMFLAGNSSGGHIALMTALRSANGIRDVGEFHAGLIKGVIAESAPTDMFMCAAEPLSNLMPKDFRPSKDLLGVDVVTKDQQLAHEAGCKMYIDENTSLPPILLFHGVDDNQVNIKQSRYLYDLLTGAGKEAAYYEIEGAGHGGAVFWSDTVLNIISEFVHQQ
ncbi:MAG: alpha/beta hydrolase [Acetatifactor sp.]|nr:alpha/beta hydrolase [Acetatifactor sp.]